MSGISDEQFLPAKLAFVDMETTAGKWLQAAAVILVGQHEENPEGIELNIGGVVLRLTLERIETEEEDKP